MNRVKAKTENIKKPLLMPSKAASSKPKEILAAAYRFILMQRKKG